MNTNTTNQCKRDSIPGGYYLKPRCIKESDISSKPPHFREIWDYLIREANHATTGKFMRGQCIKTMNQIIEDLKWYAGWRLMSYKKSQCENALKYLMESGMIEKRKTTRGMIITICKYDYYQNPQNYETNSEPKTKGPRSKQSADTINKNDKNKKEKEEGESNLKSSQAFLRNEFQKVKTHDGIDFIHAVSETDWIDRVAMRYELNTFETLKKLKDFLELLSKSGNLVGKSYKDVKKHFISLMDKYGYIPTGPKKEKKELIKVNFGSHAG